MTIIEQAHELGKLIKESPEMAAMQAADEAQAADDTAQELLKEFNLKRMNLARDMQENKITREEAVSANSEAFAELLDSCETIRSYVEAKKAFDAVVQEINGILNYYITGQEPGCTHNCSSCGGCH
jgi:cell fate (sporulation/competence/biofilm development) regulator YlbF (YheA/YmcA/DUF963 family)